MKSTLTQLQIFQIFSQYNGAQVAIRYNPDGNAGMQVDSIVGVSMHGVQTSNGYLEEFKNVSLLLIPAKDIRNDHALIIADILGVRLNKDGQIEKIKWWIENKYRHTGFFTFLKISPIVISFAFDQLKRWGYIVPLFIETGNPDNGKTAIELGLAIEKK